MTARTVIAAAAIAVGTLAFADRAEAQWRRTGYTYAYPTYGYVAPAYMYTYPTTPGVVTASYATPYTTMYTPTDMSWYSVPFSTGYYVYPGPNVWVGPRGGVLVRRPWRW